MLNVYFHSNNLNQIITSDNYLNQLLWVFSFHHCSSHQLSIIPFLTEKRQKSSLLNLIKKLIRNKFHKKIINQLQKTNLFHLNDNNSSWSECFSDKLFFFPTPFFSTECIFNSMIIEIIFTLPTT